MASVKQLQIGNNVYDIKATYDINNNSLAIQELTQAEYDALSTAEQNNGTTYYITDGNGGGASGGGSSGGTVDAYTKSQTNALLNTKANTADLATVATSGSYNDLSNKPTNVSALTNDAGYLTSIPASSVAVELTQAEYNALSSAEKNNGTTYYITDAGIGTETASNINYSNSISNLSANTVQGAIDENASNISSLIKIIHSTFTISNASFAADGASTYTYTITAPSGYKLLAHLNAWTTGLWNLKTTFDSDPTAQSGSINCFVQNTKASTLSGTFVLHILSLYVLNI